MNQKELDEQSKRLQDAIEAAKRDEKKRKSQSPEAQAEQEKFAAEMWEWEKGLLENPMITVRDFIGNPRLIPPVELSDDQLVAEVDRVIEILESHNIIVGFLGDFTYREVYETIWFKLLREEMSDNYHPEWRVHFDYTSPAYNIEQAIDFVISDLSFKSEYAPTFFAKEAFDGENRPITHDQLRALYEKIWNLSPLERAFSFELLSHKLNEGHPTATARVVWKRPNQIITVEPSFKLQPDVYSEDGEGFEVVQTNLFELLLSAVE